MGFKLIRTDSEDPQKIKLQNGTHTFGRGKLLNCQDHRVSRTHGQLEVTEESLVLTALHQNPCFFIKAGTTETQVLKENSFERLANGDKFGVLPSSYWYEVLHCLIDEDNDIELEPAEDKTDTNTLETEQPVCANGDGNSDLDTQVLLPSGTDNDEVEQSVTNKNDELLYKENITGTSIGHIDSNPCDESAPINFNLNASDDNIDQSESQSLITGNYQSNDTNAEVATEETKSPQKRTHSSDTADASDSAKRIKTEPEDVQPNPGEADTSSVKPYASDVKPDTSDAAPDTLDVKPDTSDVKPDINAGQAGSSNSGDQDNAKQPSPPVPGRERCMYGAACYSPRSPRPRVSVSQLECLLEMLKKNPRLATGYNKKLKDREFSKDMWIQTARQLNSQADGVEKNWKEWCRYWSDYKSKLRKMAAPMFTKGSHGDSPLTKPPTDLEKEYLLLLGLVAPAVAPSQQLETESENKPLNVVDPRPVNYTCTRFDSLLTLQQNSTQTRDPESSVELQIDTRSNSPDSNYTPNESLIPSKTTGTANTVSISLPISKSTGVVAKQISTNLPVVEIRSKNLPIREYIAPPKEENKKRHHRHKQRRDTSHSMQQLLMRIAKRRVEIDQCRARAEEKRARTEEKRVAIEEQNCRILHELVREVKEIKEILRNTNGEVK